MFFNLRFLPARFASLRRSISHFPFPDYWIFVKKSGKNDN